jgi:hypothetical protein
MHHRPLPARKSRSDTKTQTRKTSRGMRRLSGSEWRGSSASRKTSYGRDGEESIEKQHRHSHPHSAGSGLKKGDRVLRNVGITRHDRRVLNDRLGNQQPVERIAMNE